MRTSPQQLQSQLRKGLKPLYLVSGDEPLQLGEAADAIRASARAAGYTNRELMEVSAGFDWNSLALEADSLSLFADKKIIDLRIPSGKPGRDGSAALAGYCENPPPDTLLLVTLPKLDRSQTNSKWFKALDRIGTMVQVWPIEPGRLAEWVGQRMHSAGLAPEPGVAEMLADRMEGNLLAARQEIEKLTLLYDKGPITMEQVSGMISDSARFDVFTLVESALAGDAARCSRIVAGLRAEGLAAPVLLWALAREVRAMNGMAYQLAGGKSADQAMTRARIWDKRKPLVRQGLQRKSYRAWQSLLMLCQQADAAVKGSGNEDPWLLLEQIALEISGVSMKGSSRSVR